MKDCMALPSYVLAKVFERQSFTRVIEHRRLCIRLQVKKYLRDYEQPLSVLSNAQNGPDGLPLAGSGSLKKKLNSDYQAFFLDSQGDSPPVSFNQNETTEFKRLFQH
jgi:hypothetical protein